MNRQWLVAVAGSAAVLLGLPAWLSSQTRPARPEKTAPTSAETIASASEVIHEPRHAAISSSSPPAAVPSSSPPPAASVPVALDESSLMARLRELRSENPELTLALAREAQRRFQNSPDAAEQAWFVVKSLSDLGRHEEARLEGRKLVKDYPGTRWAEDVHRHLFVNPATHPAERGYGKDLDLP